jgi:putative PIN family toxin of toxin-antitoxin system
MRVVFDTNIFISAFVTSGSQGERAFLHARRRRCDLYTSVAILTEVAHKLREKFGQTEEDIKKTLQTISRAAAVLTPPMTLNMLTDTPDNRILECARAAPADLMVTGDRHLLDLKQFQGIPIVRLVDFLRMFPDE